MGTMTFDLTTEPWVPVVDGGRVREVSLLEIFERGHELTGLAATPSTMQPVLLRLLLALALDVWGAPKDPEEWGERFHRGTFEAREMRSYLAEHQERFDLFHPTMPFGQVADLATPKGETKPSSLLVPSTAAGNNVPLFSPRTEGNPPRLTPAEAARYALHVHAWDTAGIKTGMAGDPLVKSGKTTGNLVGVLGRLGVVVLVGRNLFDTLLLNTPIISVGLDPADRPWWRRDPPTATWDPAKDCSGYLDLLTWQSRRIRLIADRDEAGRIVVTEVVIGAGDRPVVQPQIELHTAWRKADGKKAGEAPRPLAHRAGREAWRGLEVLLALGTSDEHDTTHLLNQLAELVPGQLPTDYPLRLATSGVEYGTQSAVVEDVLGDELPLPVVALQRDGTVNQFLRDITTQTEQLERAVDFLDADLRRACGGDPIPWSDGQRPGTMLVHRLDPYVRRLLAGLSADPQREEDAFLAWTEIARRETRAIAQRLLEAVPPTAYEGREGERKRTYRVGSAIHGFQRRLNEAVPREDFEEVG